MEFEWKVIFIWDEMVVWQNDLRKATFVLEEVTDKEYPASIAIDVFKEKVDRLKELKVWDIVKVWLNIRAKEYNWRYFNNISAWRIDTVESNWESKSETKTENNDDLPF